MKTVVPATKKAAPPVSKVKVQHAEDPATFTTKVQVAKPVATAGPNWQAVLDNLGSEGNGPFFFLKSSKTRIRLVNFDADPTNFFCLAQVFYQGRPKQRAVVFGQVLSTEGKDLSEKWQGKIVPIVVAKTAVKGIISLLAEGYELFDGETGYGITIIKSGKGTDTEYNILPSPNAVPIVIDELVQPEMTLEEYAELLQANSAEKNGATEGEW